ncbi:MAG: tetratricopeptide repeat protein [Deltaproteobacteria bacterium]|nr:tetratricopeptide repeat protein [Deltaproteobacteria bacterium]
MSKTWLPCEDENENGLRRALSHVETAVRRPPCDFDFEVDGEGPPRDMAFLYTFVGDCYRSLGKPQKAAHWYQEGLEAPDIDTDSALTLLRSLSESYRVLGRDTASESVSRTLSTIQDSQKPASLVAFPSSLFA